MATVQRLASGPFLPFAPGSLSNYPPQPIQRMVSAPSPRGMPLGPQPTYMAGPDRRSSVPVAPPSPTAMTRFAQYGSALGGYSTPAGSNTLVTGSQNPMLSPRMAGGGQSSLKDSGQNLWPAMEAPGATRSPMRPQLRRACTDGAAMRTPLAPAPTTPIMTPRSMTPRSMTPRSAPAVRFAEPGASAGYGPPPPSPMAGKRLTVVSREQVDFINSPNPKAFFDAVEAAHQQGEWKPRAPRQRGETRLSALHNRDSVEMENIWD